MEKVKLTMNALFAGIGTQERGIENSGCFDLTVICTSEIDKEAIISYAAIHKGLTPKMVKEYPDYPSLTEMKAELAEKNIGCKPDNKNPLGWLIRATEKDIKTCWLACRLNKNLGDISKIEALPYADLWTVSFPCQDISAVGKKGGFEKGSGTRSSLVWEQIRLLEKAIEDGIPPKYLMFENVDNLYNKYKDGLDKICSKLSDLGYNSHVFKLDGEDCGIPQSRKRVFVVCIRKDIDTGLFEAPQSLPLEIQLEDILEDDVGEGFYIKDKGLGRFFREAVAVGALPDPNTVDDPIAVVRDKKWFQGKNSLENNEYFGKEHIKEQESYLLGNCRKFVKGKGYYPHIFVPKGRTHVKNHIARCLLTKCGSPTNANAMVVLGVLPIHFGVSKTVKDNIKRLFSKGVISTNCNDEKEEKK